MMKLSGRQIQQIRDAILAGYPTRDELRALVRIELNENLEEVAGDENLRIVVFNLVAWAEQNGRINDLVRGACNQNPGNPALQQLAQNWQDQAAQGDSPTTTPLAMPPLKFDWVTIPAGKFRMGSTTQQTKQVLADCQQATHNLCQQEWFTRELPQHEVDIAGFQIARTPVTVARFAAFVEATGYRTTAEENGAARLWSGAGYADVPGVTWDHPRGPSSGITHKQDHPVTCVSWFDAQAFCQWADVLLPTEAQWEKAARGTDGRIYPWGNTPPSRNTCNFHGYVGDTTPVGSYPKATSPYSLLDMAGNVWEWTASHYQSYPYDASDGRESSAAGHLRTLRGGSWGDFGFFLRCADRYDDNPSLGSNSVGFRVASKPD